MIVCTIHTNARPNRIECQNHSEGGDSCPCKATGPPTHLLTCAHKLIRAESAAVVAHKPLQLRVSGSKLLCFFQERPLCVHRAQITRKRDEAPDACMECVCKVRRQTWMQAGEPSSGHPTAGRRAPGQTGPACQVTAASPKSMQSSRERQSLVQSVWKSPSCIPLQVKHMGQALQPSSRAGPVPQAKGAAWHTAHTAEEPTCTCALAWLRLLPGCHVSLPQSTSNLHYCNRPQIRRRTVPPSDA